MGTGYGKNKLIHLVDQSYKLAALVSERSSMKSLTLMMLVAACLLAFFAQTRAEDEDDVVLTRERRELWNWLTDKVGKAVDKVVDIGKKVVESVKKFDITCTKECAKYHLGKRSTRPAGCCCGKFFWEKSKSC